jgi:hypothetical protein
MLDLGMRCNQLFKTSDNLLKQKILRVLVYNVELYNKSLSYTVNDPYKAFIELNKKDPEGSDSHLWCKSIRNLLLQKANELESDVAFSELVESLQLKGDLLAV